MATSQTRKAVILSAALAVVMLLATAPCVNAQTSETLLNDVAGEFQDVVYPLEDGGLQLRLDCLSLKETEARRDVLLVHGLTYSSHVFDVPYKDYSLARYLARHGFRVWRIDIAGYGRSERPDDGFVVTADYAAQNICAALTRICELMNVETVDLLGWSWGTITTGIAASRRPELIGRHVLYAPVFNGLGEQTIADDYYHSTWEHATEDFQKDETDAIRLDIVEQSVVDAFCSNCWRYDGDDSPNGGRREVCRAESVVLLDLEKLSRPTLVVCGDKDPYMDMPQIRKSLDKTPQGSKLVVIPGAAHCAMIEKPFYHEFQQSVLDFLTAEEQSVKKDR